MAAYKNLSLALHGIPVGSAQEHQIGALPYLFRGGRLYLVIVTNSAQSRWIIPKGQPEPDMPRQDVAVIGEESGILIDRRMLTDTAAENQRGITGKAYLS